MKENQVEKIIGELLKDRGKVWKPEEIEEYLRSYEIDKKQMIAILKCLVDDFAFKWLDFVNLKLPELATEENFIDLLRKVILKIKGDMAQGGFIRTLINIGERNSDLGIALYGKMVANKDEDLIHYSSFLLGGAGKKDFNKVYSLIEEGLQSENPFLRTTCVRSLRVVFEDTSELQRSSEIFEVLNKLSKEQEDIMVQVEVLNAYFDFSRFIYDECVHHLFDFAGRKNSVIRFNLANILFIRNLRDKQDEIELLKLCAEDVDKNVLSRVAMTLSKKGSEFPEKSLKIVKNWIRRGKYFDVYEIDYSIREIGKIHPDRCIREVATWLDEKDENGRLQFFVPIVLTEVSSQSHELLIQSIKPWLSRDRRFKEMALQTMRRILTEIYPSQTDKMNIINSCFEVLSEMANSKGINVQRIIRGEPDKLFQCFRLIEELRLERKELDFEVILRNLENYKAICDFLGADWFRAIRDEKNKTHPLLISLSYEDPNEKRFLEEIEAFTRETNEWKRYLRSLRIKDMLKPTTFLQYLNEMLQLVVSKSAKLREIRAGLKNETQFWETLSEIEVISSFARTYNVDIAPKINHKRLDLRVELNGENLFIEVISPNMFKPLRYISGKALDIKNRVRDKVHDEFKAHLKDMETQENTPIAIVIDIGRSEISYDFVEDCLMGSLQLTMLIDKKTGKVVKEYATRAENSMHDLERGTDVLSAVICYKTSLGKDLKFHKQGKIIPNVHARNPLSRDVIEKVDNSLFG